MEVCTKVAWDREGLFSALWKLLPNPFLSSDCVPQHWGYSNEAWLLALRILHCDRGADTNNSI